jgi:glycine/serine hydroxymethyltransferase
MKEKECAEVASIMLDAIEGRGNAKRTKELRERVKRLAKRFPIPEAF